MIFETPVLTKHKLSDKFEAMDGDGIWLPWICFNIIDRWFGDFSDKIVLVFDTESNEKNIKTQFRWNLQNCEWEGCMAEFESRNWQCLYWSLINYLKKKFKMEIGTTYTLYMSLQYKGIES